jgi:hypothetical protein
VPGGEEAAAVVVSLAGWKWLEKSRFSSGGRSIPEIRWHEVYV